MRRVAVFTALCLGLVAAPFGSQAAVRIDGNPEAPSYYWPGPEGLRLVRDAVRIRDGEIEHQGSTEMICGPDSAHEGLPVKLDDFVFHRTDPDGTEWRLECTVMQAVNDSVSCTLGMQYGDGEMTLEDTPYIDLQAPLKPGAGWHTIAQLPAGNPGLESVISYEVDAEIVETGVVVSVPVGTFSNCVWIRETARSVESHALEKGPLAGRRVRFEQTIDRWWCPGLGCIREYDSARMIAAGVSADVLSAYTYESELIEIIRP